MELSIIPNILYSKNPFLISKIHEYIGNTEKKVNRTIINVKYWYASMPDECKSVFHKVVENRIFKIKKGIYLKAAPNAEIQANWAHLERQALMAQNAGRNNATTFSDAIDDKKLGIPAIIDSAGYSLIDNENNFVFFVTTKGLWIMDQFGNKVMALYTSQQHALLVYAAVRGIGIMEENIKAIEVRREKENLKQKIMEAYK